MSVANGQTAKAFPFIGNGCYLLEGKVVVEFDFLYIEVAKMKRLAVKNREDENGSRLKLNSNKVLNPMMGGIS